MKKIMIALTIVVCATMAQAATVAWNVNYYGGQKVYGNGTTASWTSSGTGHIAYLCLADSTSALETAIKNNQTITTSMYVDKVSTFNDNGASTSQPTGNKPEISLGTQDFKVLLVYTDTAGDKYYKISSPVTKAANGDETVAVPIKFNSKGNLNSQGWNSVPEPTSAMLMLLGMAGLALRRRRA